MTRNNDVTRYKFKTRVLEIIKGHDTTNPDAPLFLCYTPHIVHEPLEVPNATFHAFDFIANTTVGDYEHHRQAYAAMVNYMDAIVGAMVTALKANRNMWSNTLWFFSSDNGGTHEYLTELYVYSATASSVLCATLWFFRTSSRLTTAVCTSTAQRCIHISFFKKLNTAAPNPAPPFFFDFLLLLGDDDGGGTHIYFAGPTWYGAKHTANNWPLRGSKVTDWQGGIRVNAFVSGGLLQALPSSSASTPQSLLPSESQPQPQRQHNNYPTKLEGFVHIADLYTTWCALAGVAHFDERGAAAGLPAVDGLNLWPYLSGQVPSSPRTEVFASATTLLKEINGTKWKLFGNGLGTTNTSVSVGYACWSGPQYPNATKDPRCDNTVVTCPQGCLFNIDADPHENENVAAAHPDILATMHARLHELQATVFSPHRGGGDPKLAVAAAAARGNYWGPFVFP